MKKSKPHYRYSIPADSPTGKELAKFVQNCNDASERARSWAMSLGASSYYESPTGMAGGCAALEFSDATPPKGWEAISNRAGEKFYLPPSGSLDEMEMFTLPVVSETALIAILQLVPVENKDGKPLPFTFGNETPIVFQRDARWYVDVPYSSASPDCTPIAQDKFAEALSAVQKENIG